eukprot:GEMP01032912.1.p1 GENE.GEMP01032912.1~~GEMP01032912.1.p1  ORF type:complete len:359 (+),score=50.48 GEMP01032912.1:270-1346(+)
MEGFFKESYTDGSRYEGDFRRGRRHGRGILHFRSGAVYEGQFSNDLRHGTGVLTDEGHFRYDGEWKKNQEDGYGEKVWADGSVWRGQWVDGELNGVGTMEFVPPLKLPIPEKWTKSGIAAVFEGDIRGNQMSGHSKLRVLDADNLEVCSYEGQLFDGKLHGTGEFNVPGLLRYKGQFVNNIFQGILGNLTRYLPTETVYRGAFHQGEPHGDGKLSTNSTTYEGQFDSGQLHGYGVLRVGNAVYEGTFEAGNKHGQGTYSVNGETVYTGSYVKDHRCGFGRLIQRNGTIFEGEFQNSQRHGTGRVLDPEGVTEINKGRWAMNQYIEGNIEGEFIFDLVHWKPQPPRRQARHRIYTGIRP